MPFLPPFLLGTVVGLLLKLGYDWYQGQHQPASAAPPLQSIEPIAQPAEPVAATRMLSIDMPVDVAAQEIAINAPPAAPLSEQDATEAVLPESVAPELVAVEPDAAEASVDNAPTAPAIAAISAEQPQSTASSQSADDFEAIHGIGPVFAARLRAGGVNTFAELAQLTPERVLELIAPVPTWHRTDVGKWIAEAQQLAAGQ